jgi:hypothetical protein
MAMQTIDSIVLQARIRFNQLTKPDAIRMALKAGISENVIEGCTITVLKNILTRRYLLGAIVAVWKQFPADVTRYIGEFFECDHLRIHRIHRQIRKEQGFQTVQLRSLDNWFRYNEANPLPGAFFHEQTRTRIYILTKQTMDHLALASEFIAEKYKVLQVRKAKELARLKREQSASINMSSAQFRIDGDINAHTRRYNIINGKLFLGRNLAEQDMLQDMYELTLEAEEMERRLADHAVRELEAKEAAKAEKKKQWLAAKVQEKKAAATERQKKENARLAQRALDRKRVKKEVKW